MRTLLAFSLLVPSLAVAADLDSMCAWDDARWEHTADLLFQGTDIAFARVWEADGVRLDATLGVDPTIGVRLRAEIRDDGLLVKGDIDPNASDVFALSEGNTPLGWSAMLVEGGRFSVLGPYPDGSVEVAPHRRALEAVWDPHATGTIACERITVHDVPWPTEEAMLEAFGFPTAAERLVVPRGKSLRLRAEAKGLLVAVVQPERFARDVYVVDRDGKWAYVAFPHWSGTVWRGWVKARAVVEDEGFGVGGLGARGSPGAPSAVRCDTDVPLHARVGGWTARVGTVRAHTPFHVESEGPEWWTVTFPTGWIAPTDKSTLFVPAYATLCHESGWDDPVRDALEDVIEEIPEDLLEDLREPLEDLLEDEDLPELLDEE